MWVNVFLENLFKSFEFMIWGWKVLLVYFESEASYFTRVFKSPSCKEKRKEKKIASLKRIMDRSDEPSLLFNEERYRYSRQRELTLIYRNRNVGTDAI